MVYNRALTKTSEILHTITNPKSPQRLTAILLAVLVTFLWSSSWVLIKMGLKDLPAIYFAGLRYTLAFFCLLPFAIRKGLPATLRRINRNDWGRLIALGVLFYALTQGAQFLGLEYLPAVTVSMLLNFTSPVVAFLGILFLAERPTLLQWGGMLFFLGGVIVYFYPTAVPEGGEIGVVFVSIGVLANALSAILGRKVNRAGHIDALTITVISMGVGGILLLVSGYLLQDTPPLKPIHWAMIGWLAIVNTAIAFTLWNFTLRTLTAVESSIINSTMLIQIAVIAWVFLGEHLSMRQLIGMVLAGVGVLIVQLRKSSSPRST